MFAAGKQNPRLRVPENEIDTLQRIGVNDFPEAFDLTFGLKIDDDLGVAGSPFVQTLYELIPFCLGQHEIADGKFANTAILKCAAKIFRATFDPALADLNFRGRLLVRGDLDGKVIGLDVIADQPALIVSRA